MRKEGIDVSAHQGTIDWKRVKQDGVQFAILRAGYGNDRSQEDASFRRNLKEAQAVGIPCGAYWFSYAVSSADARKEARVCMEVLRGCRLEYPVFYDFEYDSVRYAADCGVVVTRAMATEFAKAFLDELNKGGWYGGNYANPDFLNRYFKDKELCDYPLWLAHWTEKQPDCRMGIWQYTESGTVDGIAGHVDRDRSYVDYPAKIKRLGKNGFAKSEQKEEAIKPEKQRVATTTAAVNLRAAAHTKAKVLTVVPKGKAVTLLADDGWGWSKVRYGEFTGWLSNRYLKGASLSAYRTGVCNGVNVNVRAESSLSGAVLRRLKQGDSFEVIAILPDDWLHIAQGDREGYVYYDRSYLTIASEAVYEY